MENRVKFTGILRESYEANQRFNQVVIECHVLLRLAQSAAPIHGAADEFKVELEVSRSR